MGQIDVGRAPMTGFGVIARNPVAVLVWGLVFFALAILPLLLMFGTIGPAFVEFMRSAPADGDPDMSAMMRLQGQMMAVNSLAQLGQLAAQVLLMCAIFRAVLTPADSRFFYLRLGMGELMGGLMMLFVTVLLVMGIFGAVLIGVIIVAAAAAASPEAAVVLGIIVVLALIGGGIWLALRFSLAPVMSFAQRGFPLVEAWKLTQGRVGSLFLVGLLAVIVVLVLEMVVFGVIIGVAIATVATAAPPNEAAFEAFFARPVGVWAAQLAPWAIGGGLLLSLLGAVFTTLMVAPWAAVYRDLSPVGEDTAAAFA